MAALTTGLEASGAWLLANPATAQLITPRIGLSLVLSIAIGVLVTWIGLALAYFYGYPVGFYITTTAFAAYVLARAGRALGERTGSLRPRARAVEAGG